MNWKIATSRLVLLSLVAASTQAQPQCQKDVIIAGLGWAGIGAMYEFQMFNDHAAELGLTLTNINFKGFEAEDYYGGRIKAGELVSGGDKNPIAELIFRLFSQRPNDPDYLLYTSQKWEDVYYYDLTAKKEMKSKKVRSIRNEWSDAYECLQREGNVEYQAARTLASTGATPSPFSSTMKGVLKDSPCNWDPNGSDSGDPLRKLFEWYELQWEFLLDSAEMSAAGNVPLWTYYLMTDKDWFVSIEHNLAAVATATVTEYISDYSTTAQLDTTVNKIEWGASGATVTTTPSTPPLNCPGGVYTADKVLTTFSVGVLADLNPITGTGGRLFDPYINTPVSTKIETLKNTFYLDNDVMGEYKLLFVQLSETTWANAKVPNSEFIFAVPDHVNKVGKCTMWQSFDRYQKEFFDGSRAFACTLVTKDYNALTPITSGVANDLIQDTLFEVLDLSETCVSGVINFFNTSESLPSPNPGCIYQFFVDFPNELWQGAWSTFKKDWEYNAYTDAWKNPVASGTSDTLYFAGEALCPAYQGFQHGAWESGRGQAREIIKDMLGGDYVVWEDYSEKNFTTLGCEIPDGVTPPIRKSKTVP